PRMGLRRRIPCHSLPIPPLGCGLIGAHVGALVDAFAAHIARVRPLPSGHRCQPLISPALISPVAHHLAFELTQRAYRLYVEYLVTIPRGRQTCPATEANPACRNWLAIP